MKTTNSVVFVQIKYMCDYDVKGLEVHPLI